jgi:hypothetical protein
MRDRLITSFVFGLPQDGVTFSVTSWNRMNAEFDSPATTWESRCKAIDALQHRKSNAARQAHYSGLLDATGRIARRELDYIT